MGRRRRRAYHESEAPPPRAPARSWLDAAALCATLAAVFFVFRGVAGHAFLNWDDPDVLIGNTRLSEPGIAAWAFSTTFVGHYQPLAWLFWALVRRLFGLDPAAHHLLSLAFHTLNTGLVFFLAASLSSAAGLGKETRRVAAASAALVFGLHPLRVEPVAWASAFPYVLALGPLLGSVLAYLRYASRGAGAWFHAACGLYAVSLLMRPTAPGLALVLLVLDAWLGRAASWRRLLIEKLPFAALGLAGLGAEAAARRFASLDLVGPWDRIGAAAWAPFVYLGRTLWPAQLTPLDPLPLAARGSAVAGLAAVALVALATLGSLRLGRRYAGLSACWLAFLVLTAPASGLAPSGLQATADRYTYLPAVALALLAGGALARLSEAPGRRRLAVALAIVAAAGMGVASARYLRHWRDSVSLWTRALSVDPRNDVALYNLALALEERGDEAAALARYDALLRLIPDHGPARRNRNALEARRLEREAGALAQSGRIAEAVAMFSRALDLDPLRLHSRRSRGMALAELGRFEEAIPDLRAALAAGSVEPAVLHALAYALRGSGRIAEADALLAGGAPK